MPDASTQLRLPAIMMGLRSCQIFSGLPAADLESVARFTVIKQVGRDEYLFREGEPSHGFYIVQSGAINVHRVHPTGKEQVIHVFRPGESMAEAALATRKGYPANARAIENSRLLLVQKAGFVDLLRGQPELALRMLAAMSVHLQTLVQQIEDMALRDVETRLANWLLHRCPDPTSETPAEIRLETTKRTLAAELGTVAETLSRTFARFRRDDLVEVGGKSVRVLNPSRLALLLKRNLGE